MSLFQMSQGPTYDPVAVQPMRDELTALGIEELLSPEEVDQALQNGEGTALVVINSVCGCAAGNARPGVAHALQNDKIPDHNTTVFAGQDKAAVARVRELMVGIPPSSPCIGLFKDGQAIKVLQRHEIENKTAPQVAEILRSWFDEFCDAEGPSIPPEEFAKLTPYQACGSQIPLM